MSGTDGNEVEVHPAALDRLAELLTPDRAAVFMRVAEAARSILDGRRVVNVNSTATGGGVAELLQTLLAYARGAGVDARWVVVDGDAAFFDITKRIHNHLYGTGGDGGPLGAAEHDHYEKTILRSVARIRAIARAGDVVILHDPQTVGLVPHLSATGVRIVWRCHVGIDEQNERSARAWSFLGRYLEGVEAFVFSRAQFVPPSIPRERVLIISPSIDPFSAKNETIAPASIVPLLQHIGLLSGAAPDPEVSFARRDGLRGRVRRSVDLLGTGPAPDPSVPLVLQASRWDAMKDMRGVMIGFAEVVAPRSDASLVLAGPECSGVADDPEAVAVLEDCLQAWKRLPKQIRNRVHLVCVPMDDPDEAAAMVNAVQRHAAVVVQKSLAEGFGLTVTEAMWKSRPVTASAVGGIVDQIVDGRTGSLVDPLDLGQYGAAVCSMLANRELSKQMGVAGRERVRDRFLGDRHLEQWAALFDVMG